MSSIDLRAEQAGRAYVAWLRTADHTEHKHLAERIVYEIWMAGWDAAVRARQDARPTKADHGR